MHLPPTPILSARYQFSLLSNGYACTVQTFWLGSGFISINYLSVSAPDLHENFDVLIVR